MNALSLTLQSAIVLDDQHRLTVVPTALAAKTSLLATTAAIQAATNENVGIVNAYRKTIDRIRLDVEKTRKALKEIPLRIGREIDSGASNFMADLLAEEARLKMLVVKLADETAAAARAAAEEQRRTQEEVARQARQLAAEEAERQAAIRRAEEAATRARLDAERAAAAAMVDDSEAAMSAEAAALDAAEDARAEAAAIAAINAQAQEQLRANAALAKAEHDRLAAQASATVAGTKAVWAYEVVNIRRLAQHGWDIGKELVDCTVRKSEIAALLRGHPTGGAPPIIPGVTIHREFKA